MRTINLRTVATIVVAASLCSLSLDAQVLRRLDRPEVTYAEPFTTVSGVRELSDGRVIVSDSRDRSLQLIDLRAGTARAIGREGSGPAEWRFPTRLFAMPGDSTLMEDFANGRFYVIGPDGTPAPTFRIADGSPAASGTLLGVDQQGRLIVERVQLPVQPGPGSASTGVSFVLRYDRRSARVDTLGRLAKIAGERSGVSQLEGGLLRSFTNRPLAAQDLATVTTDGRVLLLRHSPYRVEWVDAQGRSGRGPEAEAATVRITQAEKEAFARQQIRPGTIIVSGGPAQGGGGAVAAGRASAAAVDAAAMQSLTNPEMTWPATKPPFLANAVFAAPGGRVWVLRTRAHDDPIPVFDVFDSAGRVVERVALPPRTRVAGFGRNSVYLVRTDDDDLQHLERHALPR